jgi:hypothetical protein
MNKMQNEMRYSLHIAPANVHRIRKAAPRCRVRCCTRPTHTMLRLIRRTCPVLGQIHSLLYLPTYTPMLVVA